MPTLPELYVADTIFNYKEEIRWRGITNYRDASL